MFQGFALSIRRRRGAALGAVLAGATLLGTQAVQAEPIRADGTPARTPIFGFDGLGDVLGLGELTSPPPPSESRAKERPTLNFYGLPGLIDMPTAEAMPDGEMAATLSSFAGIHRVTLAWQLTPRLAGTFRYARFDDLNLGGFKDYYDRSFDVRYQLMWERRFLPAIAIGLNDIAGTNLQAAEYVVATKSLGDDIKVSAGLGWGRYGSYGSIGSPLGAVRSGAAAGTTGGSFSTGSWFRGPAAPFAGVEWRPNDKWGFKLEYSSDDYTDEAGRAGLFERNSPLNAGVEYQWNETLRIGAYALYGNTIGFNVNMALNPRRPVLPRVEATPRPIQTRPDRLRFPEEYDTSWARVEANRASLGSALKAKLEPLGQEVLGLQVTADTATVWVENKRYTEPAAASGRIARQMAGTLPNSVETFRIIHTRGGVAVSTLVLRRTDLEVLEAEPDKAEQLWARSAITAGETMPLSARVADTYPRFTWSLAPYTQTSYFDPQNPLMMDVGVRAKARYEFAPGFVVQGSVTKKLLGNLNDARQSSTGKIPIVRSDWARYYQEDRVYLDTAIASWSGKIAPDIYGRLSGGYFERMYGGLSAEVLWKPVGSRLGLGAEVNYARKRDPLSNYEFEDYDIVTGHVSAYYEMKNGYRGQLDVGRYLAGDEGATLTLSRTFENGWEVSAFATMTNVSAEDFGEGSFDKGISFKIPLSWGTGQPSRNRVGHTIKPVQRDGGSRLTVPGRLYNIVRDADEERYNDGWPLIWR